MTQEEAEKLGWKCEEMVGVVEDDDDYYVLFNPEGEEIATSWTGWEDFLPLISEKC